MLKENQLTPKRKGRPPLHNEAMTQVPLLLPSNLLDAYRQIAKEKHGDNLNAALREGLQYALQAHAATKELMYKLTGV